MIPFHIYSIEHLLSKPLQKYVHNDVAAGKVEVEKNKKIKKIKKDHMHATTFDVDRYST